MIPTRTEPHWKASLASQLAKVRERMAALALRERLKRILSGLGRWLGVVALLLLVACLIDDAWDRWESTPEWVRWSLRCLWFFASLGLAWRWLIRPAVDPIDQARLAASIEAEVGGLDHELITALEYLEGNPPAADPAFVEETARRGATRALAGSWDRILPTGRLRFAAGLALAGSAPLIIAGLLQPAWMGALLARQLGLGFVIPRAISIELPPLLQLPEGEAGKVGVVVAPADPGGPLRVVYQGADGTSRRWTVDESAGRDITIPAELAPGRLTAHLGFYRSETMELHRCGIPVLSVKEARVTLPEWVGRRPDGTLWPGEAGSGDLGGWQGSTVEVTLESNLPLSSARLRVFRSETGTSADAIASRDIALDRSADGKTLVARWTLEEGDRLWQAEVESQEGQPSKNPLRRTIDLWQPTPPRVEWLPELMLPASPESLFAGRDRTVALRQALEENEVDGIPVPVGGRFRLAYAVSSRAGISQTRMVYRINDSATWKAFPLPEVTVSDNQGAFLPEFGVFEKTPAEAEVPFFALSATDPMLAPGRLKGGGRFDFRTAPIKDLKAGDRIEFAIEAEDRHQPPRIGRSAIRVKDLVTLEDFLAWWARKEKEQEKLRELRLRQGRVFEGFLPSSP